MGETGELASAGRESQAPRVLVVASGGGHWVQMARLRSAFEGCRLTYITTVPGYRPEVPHAAFHVVNDASRENKFGLALMAIKLAWILIRCRPDVVISTGAAPGYFAVRLGKLLGARTVWIDSLANADRLSLAGKLAGRYVDLWLTQWQHLEKAEGPFYRGSVL